MTIKQCIFNQIFKNLLTKVILLSELIKLRAHLIRVPSECPSARGVFESPPSAPLPKCPLSVLRVLRVIIETLVWH